VYDRGWGGGLRISLRQIGSRLGDTRIAERAGTDGTPRGVALRAELERSPEQFHEMALAGLTSNGCRGMERAPGGKPVTRHKRKEAEQRNTHGAHHLNRREDFSSGDS